MEVFVFARFHARPGQELHRVAQVLVRGNTFQRRRR
jgi:hypothetical protein